MVYLQRVNTDRLIAGGWYVLDDDTLEVVDGPYMSRYLAEQADALMVPQIFDDLPAEQPRSEGGNNG